MVADAFLAAIKLVAKGDILVTGLLIRFVEPAVVAGALVSGGNLNH